MILFVCGFSLCICILASVASDINRCPDTHVRKHARTTFKENEMLDSGVTLSNTVSAMLTPSTTFSS